MAQYGAQPQYGAPPVAAAVPAAAPGMDMNQMMMMQMMQNSNAQNAAMIASATKSAPVINNANSNIGGTAASGGGGGYGAPQTVNHVTHTHVTHHDVSTEKYFGVNSLLCCIFGFPCIIWCPIDERVVRPKTKWEKFWGM